jgi:GNAT superfamily N-acetyltransferase
MLLKIARTRAEVLACQQAIAEVYNKEYEVVFSDDSYDLDAKVEPWPHRYLMGLVEGKLVVTIGLYTHSTYVERFGAVTDADIAEMLARAKASAAFAPARKRELTKLSVRPEGRGLGYGRFLLSCAHARDFLQMDTRAEEPQLLVICSKRSLWQSLWDKAGIRTRTIKAFPYYKVHELYRSADDPMDSRLIIPDIDVPPRWYDRKIPGEYEVDR